MATIIQRMPIRLACARSLGLIDGTVWHADIGAPWTVARPSARPAGTHRTRRMRRTYRTRGTHRTPRMRRTRGEAATACQSFALIPVSWITRRQYSMSARMFAATSSRSPSAGSSPIEVICACASGLFCTR